MFTGGCSADKWVTSGTDIPASPGTMIIEGKNNTAQAQRLLIRIDDTYQPTYAERVNLERMIPRGHFTLRLDLGTLLKSNKRPLNIDTIKQVIIFHLEDGDVFTIKPIRFVAQSVQRFAGVGWDFGAANSKVWPGFIKITPQAQALSGSNLRPVDRAQHFGINEGLITDGIKGINKVKLPIGTGTWTMTLFLDDMGDWEYTPRILAQTILLNNMVVRDTQRSQADWVKTHYLKGKALQYQPTADVFDDYIERLYPPITVTFTTDTNENYLYFKGDTSVSQYLSALIIEPAEQNTLLTYTQKQRKLWWQQNWPIDHTLPSSSLTDMVMTPDFPIRLTQAQGSQYFYSLVLPHDVSGKVSIASIQGATNKNAIQTTLRQATWQLTRAELKSNLLMPSAENHIAPHTAMHSKSLPIKYLLHLKIPIDTPSGVYPLQLKLTIDDVAMRFAIEVKVLDTVLPEVQKAIGVYLEPPYHHTFSGQAVTQQAVSCDIQYLSSLGLNAIAPGLSTPTTFSTQAQFVQELETLQAQGLTQPTMAYTPFKRMVAALGMAQTISKLNVINEQLTKRGLPTVYFSIVDEPSNADAEQLRAALQQHLFKTAGHYNHNKDQTWFQQTDLNLINEGVSLTHEFLAPWVAQGRQFWLYNIEDHYFAASLLSWFLPVEGYLQWHARMPTALPFVPFDGREDDVQFLYPQAETCPDLYHISTGLGALTNGINDHRWLLWLDAQAAHNPRAKQLKQKIEKHLQQQIPLENFAWLAHIKALVASQ